MMIYLFLAVVLMCACMAYGQAASGTAAAGGPAGPPSYPPFSASSFQGVGLGGK